MENEDELSEEVGWKMLSIKNELCRHYSSSFKIEELAEVRTFVAVVNSLKLQSREVPEIFKVIVHILKDYGGEGCPDDIKFEKTCKLINCVLERLYPETADYLISILLRPYPVQPRVEPHARALYTACKSPRKACKRSKDVDMEITSSKKTKKEVKYYNYVPPPAYIARTVLQGQKEQSEAKEKLLPVFSPETSQIIGYINPLTTQNAQPPVLAGQKIIIKVDQQLTLTTKDQPLATCSPNVRCTPTGNGSGKLDGPAGEAATGTSVESERKGVAYEASISTGAGTDRTPSKQLYSAVPSPGSCAVESDRAGICALYSDSTEPSRNKNKQMSTKEGPKRGLKTATFHKRESCAELKTKHSSLKEAGSDIEENSVTENSSTDVKNSSTTGTDKWESEERDAHTAERNSGHKEVMPLTETPDFASGWSLSCKGQGRGVLHTDIVQFAQAMANLPPVGNKETNGLTDVNNTVPGKVISSDGTQQCDVGAKVNEYSTNPLNLSKSPQDSDQSAVHENSCDVINATKFDHWQNSQSKQKHNREYFEPLRLDDKGNGRYDGKSDDSLDPDKGSSIACLEKLVENIDKPIDLSVRAASRDEYHKQPYSQLYDESNLQPSLQPSTQPDFQYFGSYISGEMQHGSNASGQFSAYYGVPESRHVSFSADKLGGRNSCDQQTVLQTEPAQVYSEQAPSLGQNLVFGGSQNIATQDMISVSTGDYPYVGETASGTHLAVENDRFNSTGNITKLLADKQQAYAPVSHVMYATASRDQLQDSHPSDEAQVEDRSFERPRYLERLTAVPQDPCSGDVWGTKAIMKKRSKRAVKPKSVATLDS